MIESCVDQTKNESPGTWEGTEVEQEWWNMRTKQDTRPTHHIKRGFKEILNFPSFESPMNQPVRRAVAAGDRRARSGRARMLEVTAYPCRQRRSGSAGGGPVEAAPSHNQISHLATPARARPNPSVNRSANGRPPWPGPGYAVHFPSPGQGVLPSSPGYLKR